MSISATVPVPIQALADLETALLRLWMVTNNVVSQIEAGTDPQPLTALMNAELNITLQSFHQWNLLKWGPPAGKDPGAA